MERYEPIFALQEFEEVHSLSRLLFLDGTHFLKYIDKTIDEGSRIYQLENDFVNKAGSLSFEEQCRLSAIWCADICWLNKNANPMDLAGMLMDLTGLSKIALKENKNLYIVEDNRE